MTDRLRAGIGAMSVALVLLAYYAYTWRGFYIFQAAMDSCYQPFCDFRDFYYPMGKAVFDSGLPVEGFLYSPFAGILFALFSPLGLDAALVLWGILQLLFVALYLYLFRRLVPVRLTIQLVFVALVLSSFPVLHALTWGQVSIMTTVAVLGMLVFLERGHRGGAAALISLSASFKFYPLIFLAPFFARRVLRWIIYAGTAVVGFLFVVPMVVLGAGNTLNFYDGFLDAYRASDWMARSYNSQFLPHVIGRLAKVGGLNLNDYGVLLYLIAFAITVANVGLAWLIQRARLPKAELWSVHILFLSIPFFLKTSWPAELIYLPFGQALILWRILD